MAQKLPMWQRTQVWYVANWLTLSNNDSDVLILELCWIVIAYWKGFQNTASNRAGKIMTFLFKSNISINTFVIGSHNNQLF